MAGERVISGGRVGVRIRGEVAGKFLAAHALSPEDAIAFTPTGRIEQWDWDRFRRDGVILEARPGHYYFHLTAYFALAEARRRKWWPIVAMGAVVIALLAMLLYQG